MTKLYGAIEAGGTKFVCAVGNNPEDIRAEVRFPTTQPDETIQKALDFFREQEKVHGELTAIGIAAFGPLDPDPDSPTYGRITTTPKPGWANTDLAGVIKEEMGRPVAFDTDVNGFWGNGVGVQHKGCIHLYISLLALALVVVRLSLIHI